MCLSEMMHKASLLWYGAIEEEKRQQLYSNVEKNLNCNHKKRQLIINL